MASIRVGSLQFSVELQMAGFDLFRDEKTGKVRATVRGLNHRELRSFANKIWIKTLEEYGSFTLGYTDKDTGKRGWRMVPTFTTFKSLERFM